jgi:competence protein ComEC
VSGALEAARRHPRHVVLAALVAGLLAGPLEPRLVLLIAGAFGAVAGRPLVALLAALAVLGGTVGGQARLAAAERSALGPLFGSTVAVPVVLLEQPRPVRYGLTALARLEAGEGERVMLRSGQSVRWPGASTGAIVLVRGRLRPLGPFEQHYARRGAHAAISLDAAVHTGLRRGGAWGFVDGVRGRAEAALRVGLPSAQAALLRGMVLGQDEALDERTRDEFRAAGLSHILAASGQNVALLLALGLPLLAWAGAGLRGRLFGALALIALYVPLAGAGPSIQRAGVMGAATTVAVLAGRPASRWYALLLAAAVTLAVNPRASGDPGWQLSFAAVVAIALLAPGLRGWLRTHGAPDALADAAAVTATATLGTAPLIAFHFSQLSLASLPANLLAAPAIAPIMWLGLLSAALGQLTPALAWPLNALNGYPLAYIGWVAHSSAGVPHASVPLALHGPRALAAVYAGLGLVAVLASRLGGDGRIQARLPHLRRRPRPDLRAARAAARGRGGGERGAGDRGLRG